MGSGCYPSSGGVVGFEGESRGKTIYDIQLQLCSDTDDWAGLGKAERVGERNPLGIQEKDSFTG